MPDWSTNNIKIILKILVDQSGVDHSGCTLKISRNNIIIYYIIL